MGNFADALRLIFEINADPTQATTALKLFEEEVARSLGVSEKSLQQFSQATVAAGKDLLALAGVAGAAGGALFAAAEHAARFAEQIGHVAEKSGATEEQVSTLKFAADRVGVSFEAVDRSVGFLARNLGNLGGAEGKKAATALADLGIQGLDAHGKIKPVSELLPQIVERFGNLQAGAIKTNDAMALFGRGGREMIPVFNSMRQGFREVEERARAMGLVVGHDDVIASRQFLIEQSTLKAELEAFALTIGRSVMPWLIQLFVRLQNFPLLLEQMRLGILRLTAIVAALPTSGLSLLALPLINKRIAETTREMDQAITGALVKLDAEARAATAAGIALDKHTDETRKVGKATNNAAKSVDELAKQHAHLVREVENFRSKLPPLILEIERLQKAAAAPGIELLAKQILGLVPPTQQVSFVMPKFSAEMTGAIRVLQPLPRALQLTSSEVQRLLTGVRIFGPEFKLNMDIAQQAVLAFRNVGVGSMQEFSEAMGKAISQAIIYGDSVGQAMARALKATLASIAGQAFVQAIYSAALGFLRLAEYQFEAAAEAFHAAALFGVVGGAAAAIGAAIPGGGASAQASPRGIGARTAPAAGPFGPPPAIAPGSASAANRPSGEVKVIVMSSDKQLADYMTRVINVGVLQHDMMLVASHTKRSAPAGR